MFVTFLRLSHIKVHIMCGDLGGFGELGIEMVLNTDRPSPPSLGVNLQNYGCKIQIKTDFKRNILWQVPVGRHSW